MGRIFLIRFLFYRKLLQIDLAVLLYFGTEKRQKGDQTGVGTARFFIYDTLFHEEAKGSHRDYYK